MAVPARAPAVAMGSPEGDVPAGQEVASRSVLSDLRCWQWEEAHLPTVLEKAIVEQLLDVFVTASLLQPQRMSAWRTELGDRVDTSPVGKFRDPSVS